MNFFFPCSVSIMVLNRKEGGRMLSGLEDAASRAGRNSALLMGGACRQPRKCRQHLNPGAAQRRRSYLKPPSRMLGGNVQTCSPVKLAVDFASPNLVSVYFCDLRPACPGSHVTVIKNNSQPSSHVQAP